MGGGVANNFLNKNKAQSKYLSAVGWNILHKNPPTKYKRLTGQKNILLLGNKN